MPKSDVLRLRLEPAEKAAFQDAADISGLSLSAWIRERLRKDAALELEAAGHRIAFRKPRRKAS